MSKLVTKLQKEGRSTLPKSKLMSLPSIKIAWCNKPSSEVKGFEQNDRGRASKIISEITLNNYYVLLLSTVVSICKGPGQSPR